MITKLYKEMPYVNMGQNKVFDLEFEKYKDAEEIIDVIENILNGEKYKDKYGNVAMLRSYQDKRFFVKQINSDLIFYNMVNKLFSNEQKNYLNKILREYV